MEPLPTTAWKIDQDLQMEARTLTPDGVPQFVQKLSAAYPSTFFPAKIVQELIHNAQLPLEKIIASDISPALYKSTLHHLETALAPIDATTTTKDIGQIFAILVSDRLFPSIDDALFRTFCKVVAAKSPLSDLSSVRMQILNTCTPTRFVLFGPAFLEAVHQDTWPQAVAERVLENLIETHTYPFPLDKYKFLVRAISSAGSKAMHYFLLKRFSTFIPSAFHREEILLALAQSAPYDFPVFYFKNEFRLLEGLDRRYSANLKRVKKQCYQRLTFVQKILSPIPILL